MFRIFLILLIARNLWSLPQVSYVVETAIVKPVKFSIERRYIGTIKAEKFSILTAKSISTVEKIHVEAGKKVKKGDVLCIIEAMKLFNEIQSEVSGKIVKVMVDNAQAVEYDQPLFLVEPN